MEYQGISRPGLRPPEPADTLGHTALVEVDDLEATGKVTAVDGSRLVITCDEDLPSDLEGTKALVSVFAPDALYRVSGSVAIDGRTVISGEEATFERIQRRKWPRRRMDIPVTLCPLDEGCRVGGVPGRTIDLSIGGVCVETLRPVEGDDPMVILSLPDGTSIVSGASTVASENLGDGWRYRLAFRDLDPHDAGRLATLTSE